MCRGGVCIFGVLTVNPVNPAPLSCSLYASIYGKPWSSFVASLGHKRSPCFEAEACIYLATGNT